MSETNSSERFFEVKTELFKGPIDLLLHLVKQNELPIEKVSLAEVADQYMAAVDDLRNFDLEVAAEYLVIAATLVSVKASVLLNEPVELVEDEEGRLIDPHEALLQKLREAAVYKEGAAELASRRVYGLDVFGPPSFLSQFEAPQAALKDHDAIALGIAFKKLLERTGADRALMTISFENISIVDGMTKILDRLKKFGGKLQFEQVFTAHSRQDMLISFIGLLELCKRSLIRVQQNKNFETIWIAIRGDGDNDVGPLSSEFDDNQDKVSANG